MAYGFSSVTDSAFMRAHPRPGRVWGMPWWTTILIVFAAGRVASTVILLVYASVQGENPWTVAHPSLVDFSSMWDGRWYDIIAEAGYPTDLRYTDDGRVGESEWAFLPVYPYLVRGIMLLTGLPWPVAAVSVSLVAAAGTSLVLFRLILDVTGRSDQAVFTVVLFQAAPIAVLQQIAYAESLQWLEIALILWLILRRRFVLMLPLLILMGLTRPGVLGFAFALALYATYRWWRRQREPFPARQVAAVSVAAVTALASGIAWMVIAGVVTGVPSAYVDTELAWRSAYIGYQDLTPFTPWVHGLTWWLPVWGVPSEMVPWLAPLGVALVGLALIGFVFLPSTRRLGIEIRSWIVGYGVYLLAVFFPQSSTFRLMGPLFPALGAFAAPRNPVYRLTLVVLGLALQVVWVGWCYAVDGQDWTPP